MTPQIGRRLPATFACTIAIAFVANWTSSANQAAAQDFAAAPASGEVRVAQAPPNMSPEQMKAMQEAQAKAAAGGQPQPGQPGQPGQGDKKPEGEGDKKKDEGAGDTVKRPDAPPKPPDPRDLEVALDEHGKVPPFNFIGQPWPDVLQWFANLSNASFDWQEVPNGYLNLTTQRSYTLDEVHDLINQALTARGFTSIRSGEMFSVYKIEKLDPSVVRQASEEDLYNLRRYDFVKVSFELPAAMEVEKAKDDVKQVLSPNAKVFPLVTTRRLLVMDTVANLRTVSELLNEERMFQDGRIVPQEFVLEHARPEHVMEILKTMVGANEGARQPVMTPEQMQQQQQMMQQMQQQGQKPPKMPGQADAPKVYLAMNRRRNSILVNAPPDQLKIIKQTIEYLDVPAGEDGPVEAADGGPRTLFKYQLVTMDPEQLKITLEEIGELDPRTELRADTKSKILFARATAADHKKIAALKDELDGTGRGLHQIWLPSRLPADAVAGSIYALMGGQEQEEEQNNDYPFFYYSYRRNENEDKPKKGFRVDADIENNRLLLWANDAEFKEVQKFVAELSKSSPAADPQRTVRTLDASDPEATARLIEQLRAAWPAIGENELIINDNRPKAEPKPAEDEKKQEEPKKTEDRQAAAVHTNGARFQLAQLTAEATAAVSGEESVADDDGDEVFEQQSANSIEEEPETETKRPPITITVTKDGRVVIASKDTEALDRLEQFVGQAGPQPQRYKMFHIQHADVYDVYLNLKEFYEEELKGDTKQVWNYWWDQYDTVDTEKSSLLSKRPTLRFIWDPASNTILVANASPSQLAEIERLVKEYDQPQPDDAATERVTRPVKIQYSKASVIVGSLKEVFRDLLSSKDKEFDSKDGQQRPGSGSGGITVLRYSPGGSNDNSQTRSAPVKVGFQGALSLGADDVSNIVLVSAQKDVFDLVDAMIQKLDKEAAPQTTVRVHRITGNIQAAALQKALDEAVGTAWLGNRPEQTGSANQGDQQQDNDRRNRDRNRDRDRGRRDGDRGGDRNND